MFDMSTMLKLCWNCFRAFWGPSVPDLFWNYCPATFWIVWNQMLSIVAFFFFPPLQRTYLSQIAKLEFCQIAISKVLGSHTYSPWAAIGSCIDQTSKRPRNKLLRVWADQTHHAPDCSFWDDDFPKISGLFETPTCRVKYVKTCWCMVETQNLVKLEIHMYFSHCVTWR